MQKRIIFLTVLFLTIALGITAQVTTSSINGLVTAGNEHVIGATVTAVHVPSGTSYNAVTNANGRYTIQGMRVGGPYTLTIKYIGYKNDVRSNISLTLGEATVINADLKEDANVLGEVTVTGKAGTHAMGAASNFNELQIANTPTVDRSIYDVAKLSPLVNVNKFGGISIAGTNNRYNSFQIDGMVSNDVFGLTSSGTNGGQTGANPISMDAIEQVQVVASPFDVRQSGFTGGAINAITKSGTNKFTGSAYMYYTDENMYSRWSQQRDKKQKLTDETTETYGATLGGPIIKDKLFFFTSLEYKKNKYPASYWAGMDDSYFMSTATAQAMANRYYEVTGIRESFGPRDIETAGLSLMARVDWNINTNHHLSLRYQLNDSYKDNYGVGSNTYYFNNSGYRIKDKTNSFVAELTSHLGDQFYNELRAGLTLVRDNRETPYSAPTIYINGKTTVNLGTEYSSGVNSLDQNIWTLEDNLSWYLGNHTLTFGTHNEIYNMKNGFIQAAFGEYVYSNVDAFLNDENPSSFVYKYSDASVTGTTRWKTPFKAGQLGFYAQDKWDLSTALQLNYGIRFDIPFYTENPTTNELFNATAWSKDNNAVIGRRPQSSVMVSPRIGFRWFANDDHSTTLRGGIGIFNGRAPFVWIENAWANTGIEMKGGTLYTDTKKGTTAPKFTEYGAKDPMDALNSDKASAATPDLVTIDRKFKFPQAFRANLALEQQLPYGIKMTLEGLFTKSLNNVWFQNLALVNNQTKVYAVEGSESSATPYYSSVRTDAGNKYGVNSIINMSNTHKGYSYSFSAKFEKSFDFGLDLMASYTFGHSYSVNDGTSSVANSNWGYYYSVDPNKKDLSYSMYDMPHRVLVTATYNSKKYGNDRWQTHVGLTYNGYSGQRYSLTMSDNASASFNGDYRKGNSLLYIPTEEEFAKMKFVDYKDRNTNQTITADESRDAFANWLKNDRYAKDHRGQYAERNGSAAPWENHFDLHVSQDFYYLKERGSKVELVFDILNVANMLNHDWGTYYSSGYNQNILMAIGSNNTADNNKVATFSYVGQKPQLSDYSSRWHMQIGLRVTF